MNDLIQFLTSKEIMAVYLISGVVCFVCFIVYMYEKSNERVRRRHNTKELNKLVEEVRERVPEEENTPMYDEPVLEEVEEFDDVYSVSELLDATVSKEEPVILNNEEEELEYTTIEPDPVSARLELERLTKELEAQEAKEPVTSNLYEEEQEASAIISIDELLKRGKELYESNEAVQYEDDGNEPISIQDLEERIKEQNKVVAVEEKPEEENKVVVIEEKIPEVKEEVLEVKPAKKVPVTSGFKSTPFISPIFGIEKDPKDNNLELENTANYDKLDEQIKKSNEFVMSLKEFQSNLD